MVLYQYIIYLYGIVLPVYILCGSAMLLIYYWTSSNLKYIKVYNIQYGIYKVQSRHSQSSLFLTLSGTSTDAKYIIYNIRSPVEKYLSI